jgi:hypothetical protein
VFNNSASKLLDLIIEKKSLWRTPLKDRDDLLGILFGYGSINAELYRRREEIETVFRCNRAKMKQEKIQAACSKKWIYRIREPSAAFTSFEEEFLDLQNRLVGFCPDDQQMTGISLPCFAADHSHEETKQLIKTYKQHRREILKKYSDGCVLETSLLQLCAD